MVSALDSGSRSGFQPWPGHCAVFMGLSLQRAGELTLKFLFRTKHSVRLALAVVSSMCLFHLRSLENGSPNT